MTGPTKFLFPTLLLVLAGCVHTPTAPEKTSPQAEPANNANFTSTYLVQPGDNLIITVWKEKDLQGEFIVQPDGGLNFPLAGEIDTSGKTINQIQKELKSKLTKYVPDPTVTVIVKQSLGNRIFVIGKVNKPGDYAASRDVDVMQALTMAGGLTPYASPNNIRILRRDKNGTLESIPFEYSRVEKGQNLEQNIILRGGDTVVVP
jgi:polysaccharide export outer membrane protein